MDTETQKPLDLATIKSRLAQSKGKQYWRTLGELAETPHFMEVLANEVPQATRTMHLHMDRRQFLTLAGASLALAGMSGCRYLPEKKLIPYVHQPEEMVEGIPMYYASAVPNTGGYGTGAIITSREGRPIKIEGNPDHPASLGATDAFMQAAILPLYDPDRSQTVLHKGEFSTWTEFFANARHLTEGQSKSGGSGMRIVTETVTSPTLAYQLQQMLSRFPQAKWIQYEPAGSDNVREGARIAFGEVVQTLYHFDKANRILALDADFLLTMPGNVRNARDFMNARKIRKDTTDLSRLYVIESTPSITGAMADHHLTLRSSEVEGVARAVASRLGVDIGGGAVPAFTGDTEKLIAGLVKDLQANAGTSVVLPGELQPAAVHVLAHAINAKLGNVGKTVTYTDPVEAMPQNQLAELTTLVKDMKAGTVEILFILGGNPVYTAPADLDFANALISVPYKVHQAQYEDETSLDCDWHLPESHFLEAWSDIRAYDGAVSLIQPLINPLYDSKSIHELLSGLFDAPPETIDAKTPTNRLTEPRDGYAIVRSYWASQSYTDDTDFNRLLHDGIVPNTAAKPRDVTLKASAIPATKAITPNGNSLEIMIRPDPTIWDGRHANNGWLQELPKPFSKVVWDNVAYVSIDTADKLQIPLDFDGAASSQMVSITVKGQKIVAPIWVLPGHPNDSVTLHLGYGRSHAGQIGNDIGFNAYKLFLSDTLWTALGTVEKTGDKYDVATTQHHHLLEGRDIVRSGTITQFKKRPSLAPEAEEAAPEPNPAASDKIESDNESKKEADLGRGLDQPNIYPANEHRWPQNPADPVESFGAYSWGMSIDLQSCIGCNACMIACQSENNIPVVGKTQVLTGRHMNWIRIDTYYKSPTPEPETMLLTSEDTMKRMLHNPEVYFQPMTCQQCEQAPCEPVCPVGATIHSHEGLNQMIYNRCIGTRYCSNNCPYKVRRFNFYNYANHEEIPVKKMLYNPEVTVRGRGVMEKCMYCVQRINHARQKAKIEGKQIQDGEIVTACQQACPTEAIVFGNISDRNSKVYQLKTQPHNYGVLAELNTRPRTTYLGRVTNPNPDIVTETEQHGG